MKVGVLTYHSANNYGTCLQCYALMHLVEQAGYDCDVIDYRGEKLSNSPVMRKGLAAQVTDFCVRTGSRQLKRMSEKEFHSFRQKHFHLSQPVTENDLPALAKLYDLFISGSDQVWNPYICGCPGLYLQEFVQGKTRRGSYAASFGITELPQNEKERFKRDFEQFDFLAVREPEGAKIIRDLTGREAAVVLDPTLLLTAEEWREAEEPLDLKKPFIFVYMLGASSRMLRFATTLKKKTGMQLVFCPFPVGKPPISRWYPFISPAKWLWLMRNASYVVTNSFHGTAFSLNYEKKFFVDISDNLSTLSSRITRLLSLTGQENRLIGHGAEEAIDTEIDYAPVRVALGRERERSRAYLLDMLAKSDTNGGEA